MTLQNYRRKIPVWHDVYFTHVRMVQNGRAEFPARSHTEGIE